MKLKQILKKLESEHGWSFYDEKGELHLTEMQKQMILDVATVVKNNLVKPDVMQSFCVCPHGFKKKNSDCCAICGGKWKGRPKQNVA